MQILPYWCISLLFWCISFLLKVCCILHEVSCWKSRVMLNHLDAPKMEICNYKFACMLHSWICMFMPGRCSKVKYVDSFYCSKFGHFNSFKYSYIRMGFLHLWLYLWESWELLYMYESLWVWIVEFLIVSLCLNMHEWLTCVGWLLC